MNLNNITKSKAIQAFKRNNNLEIKHTMVATI